MKLTPDRRLDASTSVVVPSFNEEANVAPLVRALIGTFDEYLCEIIFVDDASTDGTVAAVRALGSEDPRVRVMQRTGPAGVGLALRDGYAAARGRYILSMDADFRSIVPELRDMFEAIGAGRDGAIGSRFSHDSILVNYPFPKIVANRGFHLLARLVLRRGLHDVSNNLKLFRANILKEVAITRPDFGANVETGLKPILAGYDIQEVPVSWINRTDEMGTSSFRLARLGPSYLAALRDMLAAGSRRR